MEKHPDSQELKTHFLPQVLTALKDAHFLKMQQDLGLFIWANKYAPVDSCTSITEPAFNLAPQ